MTDDRIKNRTAINQLVSEFLELPIVEISEKPDSNKQRERYFRLIDIAERVGSGNYDHVEIVNLFITLENKANEMVNQLIALSHATDLEGLAKSGLLEHVDDRLIDAADNAHKHYIKKNYGKNGQKAAKEKHEKTEETKALAEIEEIWKEWRLIPDSGITYENNQDFSSKVVNAFKDVKESTVVRYCSLWAKKHGYKSKKGRPKKA